ncbi:DUF2125 domain-containing protein [Emcibacter sp.]|uniref:DUF2125 domain-containing protein n=1 Tax=Emcibacter sp. TaxID=1979954 RepID=UPI002AA64C33|nr:DUF2125 domain-containing protein [Emcibacter sp.]
MRFKALVITVLVVVGAYSAFWFYLAGKIEEKARIWIAAQESKGVRTFYGDLSVEGFPYKIVLKLSGLRVTLPSELTRRGEVNVAFPELAVVAFPWKLTHAVVSSAYGDISIGSLETPDMTLSLDGVKSSLILDRDSRRLERLSLAVDRMSWAYSGTGERMPPSEARDVHLHVRRALNAPEGQEAMELPALLETFFTAKDVVAHEIPVGIFGRKADSIQLHAILHGSRFPRYTYEDLAEWRDEGGTLAIRKLDLRSGKMDFTMNGDVSLDQDLKPLGAFSSQIRGLDHIVAVLSGHPAFQQEPGDMILEELKNMGVSDGGEEKVLPLSISLQNGLVFVGPIPVYELKPLAGNQPPSD